MAYELAPAHAARRRRTLRAVLVLVGVTLLVCCVGAAGLGAWSWQSVRRAEGPARQAADGFLRALSAGDLDGAYSRLCAGTRDRMGRGGFADWARARPIDRYAISDVRVTAGDGGGGLKGTVSATLTWKSGVVVDQSLPMVTEGGDWRVCGYPG